MSRFDDLVKLAREGDSDALDALETEFGTSTLRDQAEKAGALEKKWQDSLPLIRKAKFQELFEQLDDDLKKVNLSVDAFGEFDPADLTLDMVKDKAKSTIDEVQASRLSVAKEAGFDTVEEFEVALNAAKQKKAEQKDTMETIAGGTASSGGEPSGGGTEDQFDKMSKAHEKAKKEGQDDGRALGVAIGTLIESQMEEVEPE